MDLNDAIRNGGENDIRNRFDKAWTAQQRARDNAHEVFRKWLSAAYDIDILDAVLAARASHELGGDPLWLLVISGSGAAKTETVSALADSGAHITSTITSEGALLSATPKKSKVKEATGGLLRKIGNDGVLVVKDVTSILAMNSNTRGPVLAALREIFDGRWERNVGSDGGQTLTWDGRITLIGACTTSWDEHHGVVAAMGDRFVLVRGNSGENRAQTGLQAISNGGHETTMRRELTEAVAAVIAAMSNAAVDLSDDEKTTILAAADAVTLTRTAVIADYRGEILDAHAPESPARFAKQLSQVFRGAVALGNNRTRAMELAIRCAHDSTPPLRLAVLVDIREHRYTTVADTGRRLNKPQTTVRRVFNALRVLGFIKAKQLADGSEGYTITARMNRDGLGLIAPEKLQEDK